jgi:major membrane immunogen (membrane-anchored lipoprotein)
MTAARIAALNDLARSTFTGCRVVLTLGAAALEDIGGLMAKVRGYNAFNRSNDPHGEHDFGSVEHEGQLLFWNFDYYDVDMNLHSPDAADPAVTCRVLTIMLAQEY